MLSVDFGPTAGTKVSGTILKKTLNLVDQIKLRSPPPPRDILVKITYLIFYAKTNKKRLMKKARLKFRLDNAFNKFEE